MRENDGRKLDHKTLEVLRIRAVQQVEAGAHPEEVAATLGMHRKTVYRWLANALRLGQWAEHQFQRKRPRQCAGIGL
ncbi:helix-turn-helix domain-containing protein [Actinopolymorpha alba]|uniref:helix-turn-helix domain-containing protein n=1 Tax=Actinopolymorpha alba TaxID=533267 RepID=UPI000372F3A7|nr:helix-turn-helix domain-containing protein [Actinopolymorpha alba]